MFDECNIDSFFILFGRCWGQFAIRRWRLPARFICGGGRLVRAKQELLNSSRLPHLPIPRGRGQELRGSFRLRRYASVLVRICYMRNTRPNIPQIQRLKINRSTFLNYVHR